MRKVVVVVSVLMLTITVGSAQLKKNNDAYVDKNGVLRWKNNDQEVVAFGVNYTAMFAHAYRTAKKINIDLEQAIKDDVYHFSRLSLDAFRVHVWDTEISDTLGNLIDNDHLRLFDFTISEMKKRGMKFVITPIAFWGNGYPEPDEKTPGFSAKYGKDACLVNPSAIEAQHNYLRQFLAHVNKYTGHAYKDDPDVIAFEVSNEPHHKGSSAEVTKFITGMVEAMRASGCAKPIFYNVSHSIHLAEAYYKASIQGGTFQWYPTGLGAHHELGGNLLQNVDRYSIPFDGLPGYKKTAKIVYEFDAADVGRSYIYPAMTRTFRTAGMQFATHFAYDPTFMAFANTEYNTHYMNLVYAPQKALSLKIASEAFHRVPRHKDYGSYPEDTVFDAFRVSYEEDLAEMNTNDAFFYTNNTSSSPLNANALQHVAGYGNSPVVEYDGAGAYFLDRVEPGAWRLEIMPDAIWIKDPFERSGPDRDVSVIQYNERTMTIHLGDLGNDFTVNPINHGNTFHPQVSKATANVRPGTYLIVAKGRTTTGTMDSRLGNITLNEFVAPPSRINRTMIVHQPAEEVSEGRPLIIRAQVVCEEKVQAVELFVFAGSFRPERIPMKSEGRFDYSATIDAKFMKAGFLRYYIVTTSKAGTTTFPGGVNGQPTDWGFADEDPYSLRVVASNAPVWLFNAATDADKVVRQWTRGSVLKPLGPGRAELNVNVESLFRPDPENKNGPPVYDFSFRYFFGKKIGDRVADVASKRKLVFAGHSPSEKPSKIQVALTDREGRSFGSIITLDGSSKEYSIDINDLRQVRTVILPRPYPTFLPYFFEGRKDDSAIDLNEIESIQFSIGPGLSEPEAKEPQAMAIESVRLE
jgi:hypothetical protein